MPQNRTCTLWEKIQNFVSELLLAVEKKKFSRNLPGLLCEKSNHISCLLSFQ